jgi:hypothetical protein
MPTRLTLPYVVECKFAGIDYFVAIAAFDCACEARFYAADCQIAHPENAYRVKDFGKVPWATVRANSAA